MALSEEAIIQQINVLTTKTSENPEMIYKTIAALNKALDPNYFSGNDSKIVNAINKLARDVKILTDAFTNLATKTSSAILDIYSEENAEIWEDTKKLMGENSIIEGIKAILEGKRQQELLNLHLADEGKILSVNKNDEGRLEVKPISIESLTFEVGAYDVAYINKKLPELSSVGEAIDRICEKAIKGIVMQNDSMVILSQDNEELASIPMTTDEDINNIILSLDE